MLKHGLITQQIVSPEGETICCVIKPCFNILYHRFYYHLLYQFWY